MYILIDKFTRDKRRRRLKTINSRSTFGSGWKRANCHLRHCSIDLNIKTIPAKRYTRGFAILTVFLLFSFLSSSCRDPTVGGVCPMNLEIPLFPFKPPVFSHPPCVLPGIQETSASRFISGGTKGDMLTEENIVSRKNVNNIRASIYIHTHSGFIKYIILLRINLKFQS